MELCLSMWSLHRKYFNDGWTVFDFLEFCHEQDIRNVELLDIFWKDKRTELPRVIEFLQTNRMRVVAYDVTNDFVNKDPAEREKSRSSISDGLQTAIELGTRTVRVFAGDLKPGYDYANGEAYIVEGLQKIGTEAEAAGVVLALENHGKLAGRSEQVRSIIQMTGNASIKSTFDVGNFLLVGQSPLEAADELSSLVAHVHVKDFLLSEQGKGFQALSGEFYEGKECGNGQVPIPETLKKIKSAGYNGYVSLEYEGFGDELQGVLSSLCYLRRLFETITL